MAKLRTELTALTLAHLGQLPAVTISFNVQPGISLGDAVDRVEALATDSAGHRADQLPGRGRGVPILAGRDGPAAPDGNPGHLYGAGILYESFIHPLTILSGLPSAGLGALTTLLIFHDELNIYSFVGIIMLIGIVKKNAIMMIDFALEAQRRAAASRRSHPRSLPGPLPSHHDDHCGGADGNLPIALGLGAGAEARRPLGLAVVGGLLVSQLLTLYITPVFYIYMERARGVFRRKPKRRPAAEALAAGSVR